MKKKLLLIIGLIALFLVACGPSEEAEELAEYHNNYVENVNTLAMQVDIEVQKSFATESPQETYELQTEYVLPLIEEIKKYIESQEPKTEPVKEVHELRLKQLASWEEAFQLQYQALEKTIAEASEDEVREILEQSDQKLMETAELAQQADNKLLELAEEHNVVLQ